MHDPACARYQIRVKGQLDAAWSDWFDGFDVATGGGETVLTGPVVDQPALMGLLTKLNDLGLTVLAVNAVAGVPGEDRDAAGR